ncbi:hypothetical protein [Pedobacter cryoconitis]|uniref:Uncharacterized protein n=1 Tax=Pedobacter cryoconitis TaxID=188932 RepID=A0A327RX28_9SPHI|nr:hypothetical protein [Pedobacter cryoconitis]RAJ21011.1 hypothetical protein LY11_05061 [Pedobacter cryoconitis]
MTAKIESVLTSIYDSVSTNDILYDYNASKLYIELSRNEARGILNNHDLFERAFDLATNINNLSGVINEKRSSYEEIEQQLLTYSLQIAEFDDVLYRKYIEQWLFPVEALLLYRSGELLKAESLIIEAISRIDELITVHHLDSFLFRMILQHSNLATLYINADQHEKAQQILSGILDYLFNGNVSKHLHGNAFNNESLWGEMEFLREYNAYYYFKSSIDKISRNKNKDLEGYKESFFSLLKPLFSMEVFTEERYLINAWIKTEMNLVKDDYSVFIEEVNTFFKDDVDESFDFLKVHLLDSLIIAFQKLNFNDDQAHYEEILKLKIKLGENRNLDVINTSTRNP